MAMKSNPFPNQDTEPFRRTRGFIFSLMVSLLRRLKSARRRVGLLAERAEWITWVENNFQQSKFYWTREALWKEMHSLL
jgi:hypothetical protein